MQDGKQGISHDRILMRVKDYIQIGMALGGCVWGAHKMVSVIEKSIEQNAETRAQVVILQQQVSALQQMVAVNHSGS